ncbi:MAG TPA: MarP family serine protease [Patescibacteria group bacterium]|nr:MarP family serine protease [Patescibacteria group bacterium]
MNLLDWFIVLFLIGAVIRGLEVGFIQQFFSTAGFFIGLLTGAWIDGKLVHLTHSADTRVFLALVVTLACALLFMGLGEYIGWMLKAKVSNSNWADKADRFCGSLLAITAVLGVVWMGASIFRNVPGQNWQRQISSSRIVAILQADLPSAPSVLTKLGNLLDPNGFPQVFTGLEPQPQTDTPLPDMGDLNAAVQADRASVVKIEGKGCGGIVEGSGFIASDKTIVTNAHVVAGIAQPTVIDDNGQHQATVTFFDSDLDMAVLRTDGLAGKPLKLNNAGSAVNTKAAVLGYPGGGSFTASPAAVLDSFTAIGRNIYNRGETTRQIYSLKASIQEGNSGGPLIAVDGSVIGVIFARSTTYDQVGYALTLDKVIQDLAEAKDKTQSVSTGSCAE